MRRFIKDTTPYILLLASILFWPNEMFYTITGRSSGIRDSGETLYDIRPNIDKNYGVILGSSTARRGINPEELSVNSISFHNLASSAQTVEGSLQILLRLMEIQPPDFLILDIYSNFYCRSSKEFAFDYLGRNPLYHGIKDAPFLFDQKDNFLSLLYIRSFLHDNDEYFTEQKFIRGHSTEPKFQLTETPECETIFTNPQPCNTESLSTISKICEVSKTRLIITIPPDLCDSIHTDFQNHIKTISKNSSVLDGNLWEGRKPSFFYDDHHLNQAGAIAYSSWLNSQIHNALQQP